MQDELGQATMTVPSALERFVGLHNSFPKTVSSFFIICIFKSMFLSNLNLGNPCPWNQLWPHLLWQLHTWGEDIIEKNLKSSSGPFTWTICCQDWTFCIFGESKPRRKEKEEKEREKRRKELKRKREENGKKTGKRRERICCQDIFLQKFDESGFIRFGDEVMLCKQQRAHTVVRESPSSCPIFPR